MHRRTAITSQAYCISTGSCLTTLLTVLISLRMTAAYSPTWTGYDHSASTIIRSWWKVSKCGWAHRRQTSLTQTYKNLFLDKTEDLWMWDEMVAFFKQFFGIFPEGLK
jgi:hypothetical protein